MTGCINQGCSFAVYSRESSRRQNKTLIVSAIEAECRHFLSTHNRLPPERRKIPEHTALRQFMVCDASVLIDAAGASTNETVDVLCLHSDVHRAASVAASLQRRLPDVKDIDAYESIRAQNEEDLTIDELFDDPEEESDMAGDNGGLSDAALLAMSISEMEVTLNTGYTVHTRNCVLFPVCEIYVPVVFHHYISEYDTVDKVESLASDDEAVEDDEATGIYDSSIDLFGGSWQDEVAATMEQVRQTIPD